MKPGYSIVLLFAFLLMSVVTFAQQGDEMKNVTYYKTELWGSMSTGENTPFWMVSNRYGVVPLNAGNGYLRAGVFHEQSFGKGFRWSAGLDLVAAVPRRRNVFVQQAYAELGYKSLLISVGSKEHYGSLWDKGLSSGDMVQSANARPIPEIKLSMPEFTIIPRTKGWLQVKGDFAIGRSFDTGYLKAFLKQEQTYNKEVLWHHKSIFFRIQDTKGDFPLSAVVGVQHWAQWGGTSSDPAIGVQPHSLKDLLRIVIGSEGGGNASLSDRINVLGNHFGSYDFKLAYKGKEWTVAAYHQLFFEDKSGMILGNGTDGLWGVQADLPRLPWLRKIVSEYFVTTNQSGPFHFIDFDHAQHKGPGGGGDNYYNNFEYATGSSYFNRGLGSPLIPAPEYNKNGRLGFENNQVRSFHLGIEGDFSQELSYRLLFTTMRGWGTPFAPLINVRQGTSCMADVSYRPAKLPGWEFSGALEIDTGGMVGKGVGFLVGISKRGILKNW